MTAKKAGFQFTPLVISLVITLGIGITASFFTRPEIPGWYATLQKPSFNPPAGVFAPVWTVIYIIIAISAYLVWQQRNMSFIFKATVLVYIFQLILNFMWSLVFFGMHEIFGALVVISLLWVSIIINICWFIKFSKTAAWLLAPYLLWVSFAWLLNLNIYLLNR